MNLSFLDNKYVAGFLVLFIVLYASMIGPNLPSSVKKLFSNTIFKMAILFMVLIVGNTNPSLALVIAVAFVLTLDFIYTNDSKEAFSNINNNEENNKIITFLNSIPKNNRTADYLMFSVGVYNDPQYCDFNDTMLIEKINSLYTKYITPTPTIPGQLNFYTPPRNVILNTKEFKAGQKYINNEYELFLSVSLMIFSRETDFDPLFINDVKSIVKSNPIIQNSYDLNLLIDLLVDVYRSNKITSYNTNKITSYNKFWSNYIHTYADTYILPVNETFKDAFKVAASNYNNMHEKKIDTDPNSYLQIPYKIIMIKNKNMEKYINGDSSDILSKIKFIEEQIKLL